MLTRGYFIGEIVDALSDVAGQVSTRGRLGLTDLNKYAEDFFKTILNHALGLSLVNLNAERTNEPGLDLGDEGKQIAFQVTATRTSAKVNDTLAALTDDQIKAYSEIKVLMIAGKQGSYTLDEAGAKRAAFSERDIWDVDDLCKRCMDLPVDTLQVIYNHVRSELTRVRIELEIPDTDGHYPTTLVDFIESIPQAKMSELRKFNAYLEGEGFGEDLSKTEERCKSLSRALSQLPRITREFLVILIERREADRGGWIGGEGHILFNADRLTRISRYPDNEGELRILESYGFIGFYEAFEANASGHWRISLPGFKGTQKLLFIEFLESNKVSLSRPLVALDFSDF